MPWSTSTPPPPPPPPRMAASTADAAAGETVATALRAPLLTIATIELTCLLCGRSAGALEADGWPPARPARYRTTAFAVRPQVRGRLLACGACGGTVHASEATVRHQAPRALSDWAAEQPRRGRPPKALAAARSAGAA